eukprot:gnl/MRDRNA2_/MRDRNA2_241426_c0_seq1.p1 gnl/MRDRNA2_/MRDRNA2_241426_c0~~gnl/MRDRNA2_/MRDRNA2_241426_c0_seq1.p1  ORF type:complete len:366 (-),score=51.92 gnl/MRDRNA2_/MRDRNA2_241426_c0_seq1:30-1127(-)
MEQHQGFQHHCKYMIERPCLFLSTAVTLSIVAWLCIMFRESAFTILLPGGNRAANIQQLHQQKVSNAEILAAVQEMTKRLDQIAKVATNSVQGSKNVELVAPMQSLTKRFDQLGMEKAKVRQAFAEDSINGEHTYQMVKLYDAFRKVAGERMSYLRGGEGTILNSYDVGTGNQIKSYSAEVKSYIKRMGANQTIICETGFNYGHSALTFLSSAGAGARYVGFTSDQPRSRTMQKVLEQTFGKDRVTVHYGNSMKLLPAQIGNGLECDIIHVDGGHSYEIALADLQNFARLATPQNLVLMDNTDWKDGVGAAWNRAVEDHLIRNNQCEPRNSRWCWGQLVSQKRKLSSRSNENATKERWGNVASNL